MDEIDREPPAREAAGDPVGRALEEYTRSTSESRVTVRRQLLERYPQLSSVLAAYFKDEDAFLGHMATPALPDGRPAPPAAPPRSFGNYELLEPIAAGGMGIVYKARERHPQRLVALKLLRSGVLASEDDLRRFRAEIEAAGALDHPNILPVYEVGEYEGYQYYTMRLLGGGSLADRSSLRGDHLAMARLLEKVAGAVHHAHQRGVVHRDLKPQNILFDEDGEPYVTDFGLAKRLSGSTVLTASGLIVGTLSYMAPEQAAGREGVISPATDVYSLGMILYELLAGERPFASLSAVEQLYQILHEEPPPPSRRDPAVPRDLEAICLKCLEKDPRRRYPSATDLARDLRSYLEHRPVTARHPGLVEASAKWARRHRAAVVAGLAIVAVALVSLAASTFLIWRALVRSEGHRLTAQATAVLPRDPALALLLGLEGARRHDDLLARNTLVAILGELREEKAIAGSEGFGSVAFSPDGRRLAAGGWDNLVHLWDTTTWEEVAALRGHTARTSVAFSPGGRLLASASRDGTARIWKLPEGGLLHVLTGHEGEVLNVRFSPDGRLLATASTDRTARLWEAASGGLLRVFQGHAEQVSTVDFSRDGRWLLTASTDDTARLWDAARPEAPLRVLGGGEVKIRSAFFDPEGRFAAGCCEGGSVRIWDLEGGGKEILHLEGLEAPRHALFAPGGTRLAVVCLKTVEYFDLPGGKKLFSLQGHTDTLFGAAYDPGGGRLATASGDGTVRVWRLGPGGAIPALAGHEGPLWHATFSPDGGRIATCSDDGTARVWDAATGAIVARLSGHTDSVSSVELDPRGRRAVTAGDDGTARLWDPASGEEIGRWEAGCEVSSARFSPGGERIAAALEDGTARILEAATLFEVRALSRHELPPPESGSRHRRVFFADFSPGGARVVTCGTDRTIRLWDAATGSELAVLRGHGDRIFMAVFDASGRRILSASADGTARIWDAAAGREILVLRGHRGAVGSAVFDPGGRRIVTASADRTARIWDARTGEELLSLSGHGDHVWTARFDPGGTRVVTASSDRTARLWPAGIVEAAERLRPRALTPAERAFYRMD